MLGGLTGNTLPRQYHNLLVEIQRQLTSESKRMSTYGLTEVEDSFDECQLVIEEQSQRNAQAELDRLLQAGPLNLANKQCLNECNAHIMPLVDAMDPERLFLCK